MVRVKRGKAAGRKQRKRRKRAKGFRGGLRTQTRRRNTALIKALRHATVGRKQKKRDMRRLWIARISAAAKLLGTSYGRMIHLLKKNKIMLDRKSLADLAANNFEDLKKLFEGLK